MLTYWMDMNDPFRAFENVRRRMDQVLREYDDVASTRTRANYPRASLRDTKEGFVLSAEVPGLAESDLQITATTDPAEGVLGVARHRVCLHVGGQADLDGDAEVAYVPHQVGVFMQAGAVSDPVRATVMQRLVDRLRPVRLPGMDRRRHVAVDHGVERVLVLLRGIVVLRPRQVEADDALPMMVHGEPGEFERRFRRQRAEGTDDHATDHAILALRPRQATQRRLDHRRERSLPAEVLPAEREPPVGEPSGALQR